MGMTEEELRYYQALAGQQTWQRGGLRGIAGIQGTGAYYRAPYTVQRVGPYPTYLPGGGCLVKVVPRVKEQVFRLKEEVKVVKEVVRCMGND